MVQSRLLSSQKSPVSTRTRSIDGSHLQRVCLQLFGDVDFDGSLNMTFGRLNDRYRVCDRGVRSSRPLLDVSRSSAPPSRSYLVPPASFGEHHLRAVWRMSLGLGMIPAIAVFLWRLTLEEPTRFKKDSMARVKTPYLLILRRYWLSLSAICITWFIYDFITLVPCFTFFSE